MADSTAAPAPPDAASAGGNADVAQNAAVAAAEQAVARYEANEAAGTGVPGTVDNSGGDRSGPAAPSREERLAEIETLRETHREEWHERGLGLEAEALKADEDGEGADADENAEGGAAGADDKRPTFTAEDLAVLAEQQAEAEGDAGDESDAGDADDDAGEQRTVPEDAEERAEFLPDTAEGYDLPAVEGHAWNPRGAALWQSLASTVLHGHDAPQGFLDAMGKWAVTEMPTVIQNAFKEEDREHNKSVRETLRGSWGDEYKNNLAETNAFFQSLPENVRGEIKTARLPDGRRLASSAAFLLALHETARKNSGRAPSIDERLKAIRSVMKEDISAYRAQGLDKEYQQLLERAEAGETTEAAHPDPLDRAIQATRSILRSDRERYFREGHDTRYLELLKEREAGSKKPKRAA